MGVHRSAIAVFFFLIFWTNVHGEPHYLKYKHGFGLKASNISGYGLYYGYRIFKTWRVQGVGVYYMLDENTPFIDYRHKITNYTIGIEVQKDLVQEERQRIYVSAGGFYYYDYNRTLHTLRPYSVKNNSYNWGLGLAYDYLLKRLSFGAELGYKIYTDYRKILDNNQETPEFEKKSKVGAGITAGFIF